MEVAQSKRDHGEYIPRGPGQDILRLLQRHGSLDIAQLQAQLGVSRTAVREQLAALIAAGLVGSTSVRRGVGRPAHMYVLTDKAQALFPNGYDQLLKLLLDEIEVQHGRERLRSLLDGVSTRLAEQYKTSGDARSLRDRIDALAANSEQRGVPITLVEHDGDLMLRQASCPYFSLARDTTDVCAMEQQMLEQVLGRKVRLTRRLVDGYHSCQFEIESDPITERVQPEEAK